MEGFVSFFLYFGFYCVLLANTMSKVKSPSFTNYYDDACMHTNKSKSSQVLAFVKSISKSISYLNCVECVFKLFSQLSHT